MEKLKYAVWTPRVKENQNYMYWHKYLHLHLYKVKKADNPVPAAQRTELLPSTRFPTGLPTSDSQMGTGLQSVVPKSSKLLCQSLNRGMRSSSRRASVHAAHAAPGSLQLHSVGAY